MTSSRRVLVLIAACLAAVVVSCVDNGVVAPHIVDPGGAERQSRARAELVSMIEGIEFFLAPGGFDAMLRRGANPEVVAEQRQAMVEHLATIKAELRALDAGSPRAMLVYTEPGSSPAPLCAVNLSRSLDDCFVGTPTSSTPGSGQGSVFQAVGTIAFDHSTTTTLSLSGAGVYGAPINTSQLVRHYIHSKPINYSPLTCLSSQTLSSTTQHKLDAGFEFEGVVNVYFHGERLSTDAASCVGLSLSANRTTLGRNDYTDLSIGGKPETCGALAVVSANPSVAWAENLQGDYWLIHSGSRGTVTITARCADGSAGTVSITVDYPADPVVTPTGGSEDTGFTNCGYFVWLDVYTGEWLSQPFILCDGQEPPPCCWSKSRVRRDLVVGPPAQTAGVSQTSKKPRTSASVLFVGTTEPGRAPASVQVDPTGQADAIIFVDLTRATAGDLEAAISGVSHLLNGDETEPEGGELGVWRPALTGVTKDRAATRGVDILGRLKGSSKSEEAAGRKGRALKEKIDLPEMRKYKP